jgi:hypothetical protein
MTNVTAALMSFRMIALIPHHLPRLIGFNAASRVDMEAFHHQAAWEPGGQVATGAHRSLVAGYGQFAKSAQNLGSRRQRLIGQAGGGEPESEGSMDSTLRATTDSGNIGEDAD